MKRVTKKKQGVWAMIAYGILGNLMGVWIRILGTHFEPLQQVAARAFAGGVIGIAVLIIFRKTDFSKFSKIGIKGLPLIALRSLFLVSGIILYTKAVLITKLSNIGFIFGVPTTALFGVVILKEKVDLKKLLLILLSFVGVAVIAIEDMHHMFDWGQGELMIFISTFFYASANIMRKFISPKVSNEEMSSIGGLFASLYAFLISFFLYENNTTIYFNYGINILLTIGIAGLTFVTLGTLAGIGFQNLKAIVVNNLLTLEALFGMIIGFLFFGEIPVLREIIGGIIILISAFLINREDD